MDDIEKRLRETSDTCITCFSDWHKDKKNGEVREKLIEAIHELRKVASRVEIELAVSERDEMTQKPIPVPPHRDAKRRPQQNDDESAPGNQADNDDRGGRRPQNRKRSNNKR